MISPEKVADIGRYYHVPGDVAAAVVGVECSYDPDHMTRYEAKIHERINAKSGWLAPFWTDDPAERRNRATSWGPAQVMGWRLRILGFKGAFSRLTTEYELATGYGMRALVEDLKTGDKARRENAIKYSALSDGWEVAVAVYNAGGGAVPWDHIEKFRVWRKRYARLKENLAPAAVLGAGLSLV